MGKSRHTEFKMVSEEFHEETFDKAIDRYRPDGYYNTQVLAQLCTMSLLLLGLKFTRICTPRGQGQRV